MAVCMCVCVCVCTVIESLTVSRRCAKPGASCHGSTHVHMGTCAYKHIRIYICMYIYIHMHTYIRTYIRTYLHKRAHI